MRSRAFWALFALLWAAPAWAQEIEMQVELLNPLGTETSRKGDAVSARVVSPDALRGDLASGKVTNVKTGNKLRGKSVLSFTFETLDHAGQNVPIASQIKSISNSKGEMDVDDEGHIIRNSNNLGKAAIGTGAGALLGGIMGGGKGAAIGAGAGAVGSIVMIDVAAEGSTMRLEPGSRITLTAQSRSGPALGSLSANPAAASSGASPAPPPSAKAVSSSAPAPTAAQATNTQPAASNQPDLTEIKSDFVPGEKTLFFDDFSDMAGDEPPPHWKVRGGSVALKTGGGIRQLTVMSDNVTLTPNIKVFSKNFTLETELKFDFKEPSDTRSIWYIHDGTWESPTGANPALKVWTSDYGDHNLRFELHHFSEGQIAGAEPEVDFKQPVKVALWVQNGRIRVYINGQRVADVNQIELPPIAGGSIYVENGANKMGYRMVRIAESAPDFSQVISSTGRYVTHGILFDTDSDRLKPESAPVIKAIAQGLEKNPNLKLQIEGHTDSVGNDAHNLDLSKRRAEAVKAVLVSQFGVSADRLTTVGLGPSKPIDSNDTPAGRAQNRRVELVKL